MGLNRGNKKYYSVLGPNEQATDSGTIKYVFQSNALDAAGDGVTTSDLAAIGVAEFDPAAAQNATGYAFQANFPKPPRLSKAGATNAQGTTTTFGKVYSAAQLTTAKAKGWVKTKAAKVRSVRTTSANLKKAVFVITNGLNYAWWMHKELYDTLKADFQSLGIEDCDPDKPGLYYWGCKYPKPALVAKVVTVQADDTAEPPVLASSDTFSCYVADNKLDNIPANYRVVKQRRTFVL